MIETFPPHSGPMNPAGTPAASFEAWQALVAPGDVFRHPREVLAHPLLSRADKRAILASWASDACALENAPALRCLTGCRAEPVPVDAVLAALGTLDRGRPRRQRLLREAALCPVGRGAGRACAGSRALGAGTMTTIRRPARQQRCHAHGRRRAPRPWPSVSRPDREERPPP